MALTLKIENETRLQDGGPLEFGIAGKRGFDIGRDSYLDWTLPDPSRRISGKHCEVRYRDNGYWLHDVSTNGTFLNGSDRRMSEPYRLRNGDRIVIGHYIILVTLSGEMAEDAEPAPPPAPASRLVAPSDDSWWSPTAEPSTGPPQAAGQPLALSAGSVPNAAPGDFLDWMADIPPIMPDRPREPASRPIRDQPASQAVQGNDPRAAPAQPASAVRGSAPSPSDPSLWEEPAAPRQHPDPDDWSVARRPAHIETPRPRSAPIEPPEHKPLPDDVPTRPLPPAAPQPRPPETANAGRQDAERRMAEFVAAFAAAAGIPAGALAHYNSERLGALLGELMHITVTELGVLLAGRFEAKRAARSSHQTQIGGVDNNPIKFLPTVSDVIVTMLGPPNPSYLDASRTLQSSFEDIKTHQLDTFVAMQAALLELAEDLDPNKIEVAAQDSGLSGLVGSRKSRAWDIYVARWKAKTTRHDNGLLGAFTEYFSKHYDRS